MHRFTGLLRHEIRMSIRRKSLWIAYGLLFLFYTVLLFAPPPLGERVPGEVLLESEVGSVAGRFLVEVNVFFPIAVGILSADRIERDRRLGLRELQDSTPLRRPVYVLAKYLGVLASALLPVAPWLLGIAVVMTLDGHAPLGFLYAVPVAFLAITVPAFAFVVAFSIACPLVMPLSVYQILFTGYWFWANFIPSRLFPTLNGTLVTPSGIYALEGFFSARTAASTTARTHTAAEACLNLTVLGLCIVAVLVLLERYLARQARRD